MSQKNFLVARAELECGTRLKISMLTLADVPWRNQTKTYLSNLVPAVKKNKCLLNGFLILRAIYVKF